MALKDRRKNTENRSARVDSNIEYRLVFVNIVG